MATGKVKICANCDAEGCSQHCGGCKITYYCSRECQSVHWSTHKRICKDMKTQVNKEGQQKTEKTKPNKSEKSAQQRQKEEDAQRRFFSLGIKFAIGMGRSEEYGMKAARDYMILPPLPFGKTVNVHAIGVLNYEPLEKRNGELIKYGYFREQFPEEYEKCENPMTEYEDSENVSPVTMKYAFTETPDKLIVSRIHYILWFPLNDIFTLHTQRAMLGKKKMFPLPDVYLDENQGWLSTLFCAAQGRIMYHSGRNKDSSLLPDISPSA